MQPYLTLMKDLCDKGINEFFNEDQIKKIVEFTGGAWPESWCARAVMYALCKTGSSFIWLNASTHQMMCNAQNKKAWLDIDVDANNKPQVGDIVVWRDKKEGKFTEGGHTGFVWQVNEDGTMLTLEGNTSPAHQQQTLQQIHTENHETNGGFFACKTRHDHKIVVDNGFELAGFIRFNL